MVPYPPSRMPCLFSPTDTKNAQVSSCADRPPTKHDEISHWAPPTSHHRRWHCAAAAQLAIIYTDYCIVDRYCRKGRAGESRYDTTMGWYFYFRNVSADHLPVSHISYQRYKITVLHTRTSRYYLAVDRYPRTESARCRIAKRPASCTAPCVEKYGT